MDNFLVPDPTTVELHVVVVIALVMALATVSGRLMARLARHILRFVVHDPDAQMVATAVKWWRRRLVGTACGMLIGVGCLKFSATALGADRSGSVTAWVVLGALAGGVVGATVHKSFVSRSSAATTNVAHSRQLRLVDFTSTWLVRVARGSVLVAVLLVISYVAATVLSPRDDMFLPMPQALLALLTPSFLLTALGVPALIRFELSGRRVVQRSTSARSESDLGADTILRCLVVRDLAQTAALLGIFGSLLLLPDMFMVLEWRFLGSETLMVMKGFTDVVVVLACVGAVIAIFGPARIRPPIGLPRNPLLGAEVSS
jgi:hypothetical protein